MRSLGARFSQYESQILLYGIVNIKAIFKERPILVSETHIQDEFGSRLLNNQKD